VGGAEREIDTNGVCFTLEVTEYLIYQFSEAILLMRACDSRCTEVSKTQPPLFVLVTLKSLNEAVSPLKENSSNGRTESYLPGYWAGD
jgi:hypothetical protein